MRNAYRRYVGRPVVVQVGDESLGGTLVKATRTALEICDTSLLGQRPVNMDGTVVVPIASVRWIQVA